MPELPEVETVKTQLESCILGEIINNIEIRTPAFITSDIQQLTSLTVIAVRRFSKLLVIDLTKGWSLAIHLKMTGRLIFEDKNMLNRNEWELNYPTNKHTHIVIAFQSGSNLYFNDYRRFGTVAVVSTDKVNELPYIKYLGKEFFSTLTEQDFIHILGKSNKGIKGLLLDQTMIAGVGNIYANEGLWEAQIHPAQPAKSLTYSQKKRLFLALEQIMKQAIGYGGASSDNFRDVFEVKGKAQDHFSVYGRNGLACMRCGTTIIKHTIAGRGTYICPTCQRCKED